MTTVMYLGGVLLPAVERPVRRVHGLLGLRGTAVRHPGEQRPAGRVQHGEGGGGGGPAAVDVRLVPQQLGGHVEAVGPLHGGGGGGDERTEETAGPEEAEATHLLGERGGDSVW